MTYLIVSDSSTIHDPYSLARTVLGRSDVEVFSLASTKGKYLLEDVKKFFSKINLNLLVSGIPVYIVFDVQDMPVLVQNSLLKVLEESSKTILLVTNNINKLIPTIRSRCVEINLTNKNTEPAYIKKQLDINLNELMSLEREKIVDFLALCQRQVFSQQGINSILIIEALEEAIMLLQSNCRVESVLMDLRYKIGLDD